MNQKSRRAMNRETLRTYELDNFDGLSRKINYSKDNTGTKLSYSSLVLRRDSNAGG